jgi:hypothetical protein
MNRSTHIAWILSLATIACGRANGAAGPSSPPAPISGPGAPKETIYESRNLEGHVVTAECNPGGATQCACSDSDAAVVSSASYGEVISNVNHRSTYVNAIGHKKFVETFPTGEPIVLRAYKYRGEFQLPTVPRPDTNQRINPQAVHLMIQLWDGRSQLFTSNRATLEGSLYYDLNPWQPDYGKIKIYRNPVELVDTGLRVEPDTEWHTFELVVDLASQRYVRIVIDGRVADLGQVELARVTQPSWGSEVALSITTESLASWPQAGCGLVFTWTTRFRNLVFQYF